jgi:hypothetical protein
VVRCAAGTEKVFMVVLVVGKWQAIAMLQFEESIPPQRRYQQYVLMVAQHRANKNVSLALMAFAEFLQCN